MENPSTRRSAMGIFLAPYDRDSKDRQTVAFDWKLVVHDLFSVRNMFFWPAVLAGTGHSRFQIRPLM
jgi:hypothetical protein